MSRIEGHLDLGLVARIKSRAMSNAASLVEELAPAYSAGIGGETPIERALSLAVVVQVFTRGFAVDATRALNLSIDLDQAVLAEPTHGPFRRRSLFCQGQAVVLDWPVDFVYAVRNANDQVSRLCVECDGHDFHERTKEQAAKDRSRDRRLQEAGLTIFRFTGSEIFNNPCECADAVVNWAINEAFFGHQKNGRYY